MSVVRDVLRLHLIRVRLNSNPGVAVNADGRHHIKWQKPQNAMTQVTAFETGWQTATSWLARGDVVDGWKQLLDHS